MSTPKQVSAAPAVAVHVVVMGVAGCGKSAVAARAAGQLGLPLIEGDDFHPPANIEKMSRGEPLTDEDRAGWLRVLAAELVSRPAGAMLACSALRRAYRDVLRAAVPGLRFAYLALTPQEAARRVAGRPNHFYPVSLVASQFATLEDPAGEEGVLALDGMQPLDDLALAITHWLAPAGDINLTMRN